MSIIEQRTVCDECGQTFGLFHKNCDGKWITERRTVTPWQRTRNRIGRNPSDLPDEPSEGLRRLVERCRRDEDKP